MSRPAENRFAYLDGLRGWAALLVVLHHATIAIDFAVYTGRPSESRVYGDVWLSGTPFFPFAATGNFAVCIFFALSGFVLTHAYQRSRQYWLTLLARRYLRLGLPMLVGCLLAWMLMSLGLIRNQPAAQLTQSTWLAGQFQQQPNFAQALLEPLRILFGAGSAMAISYDSSLWTMPIEAEASIVLISAFVLLRHVGKHADRIGVCAFCAATILCAGSFFSLFAFGAVLRLLQPKRVAILIKSAGLGVIGILALGCFLGTIPYSIERWSIYNKLAALTRPIITSTGFWQHSPELFWHSIGAALILLAVTSNLTLQSMLSGRTSQFLGRISFPLYILHVPLLMVIQCNVIISARQAGLPPVIGDLLSLPVFVAAAMAISALLTPLIEGGAITLSARIGQSFDILIQRSVARIAGATKGAHRPPTVTFK